MIGIRVEACDDNHRENVEAMVRLANVTSCRVSGVVGGIELEFGPGANPRIAAERTMARLAKKESGEGGGVGNPIDGTVEW